MAARAPRRAGDRRGRPSGARRIGAPRRRRDGADRRGLSPDVGSGRPPTRRADRQHPSPAAVRVCAGRRRCWRRGGARRLARAAIFALCLGERHPAGRGGIDRRSAAGPAATDPGQVPRRPLGDRRRHGIGPRRPERADGRGRRRSPRQMVSPLVARSAHAPRRRRRGRARRRLQRADRRCGVRARRAGAALRDQDRDRRPRRVVGRDPDLAAVSRRRPGFPGRGVGPGGDRHRPAALRRRRDLAALSDARRRRRRSPPASTTVQSLAQSRWRRGSTPAGGSKSRRRQSAHWSGPSAGSRPG